MSGRTDSFGAKGELQVGDAAYQIYRLGGVEGARTLPYSLKVLLENLLRTEDGANTTADHIRALASWDETAEPATEIQFTPARVIMQDFTGVPCIVDLATMREAMVDLGGDPARINPLVPTELVIDHSVIIDVFGRPDAFERNVEIEYQRNGERYQFLRWGQKAFEDFKVVPPGTGIVHQVNIEHLARTVMTREIDGRLMAYPDTCVGTDSHTTMVNGLGVLGWGVGGIEAEAAMLGQPVSMLIPEVVGFRVTGKLPEGTTATDLVLTVTQMLRAKGVVGKFVEFYGPGLANLTVEDRATIGNMAPEYGATCGLFPIEADTISYLTATGRDADRVALVEAYAKAQGMWRSEASPEPVFTDTLELDLAEVVPSLAGPKRPQDRVALNEVAQGFENALAEIRGGSGRAASDMLEEGGGSFQKRVPCSVDGVDFELEDGHVVIAAITSCTNTSNPSVLIGAGLLAKRAHERGLKPKPWVKTSLAPGSQVVTEYLEKAGLQQHLNALGFNLVGYGCTTCIGNSGPLADPISEAINKHDLIACSVLSGNRNFEGRVNPDVRANYLASPPLVVAYALAGSLKIDITREPLGHDREGKPVYLKDLWPSSAEIASIIREVISREMFRARYGDVFTGDEHWQGIQVEGGLTYKWSDSSTYVQNPPYFQGMKPAPDAPTDIEGARILGLFLDSITTDHISPAGSIKRDGPAGEYLISHQVRPVEFNSYGARRGNHEVMMRGTFANIRIKNQMTPGVEGGVTIHYPSGERMWIYEAAMRYAEEDVPLVIFAGREYGTGSSRDWAAKGTRLLGVRAVIAESFERIHRSNLVGMGVLPLVMEPGTTWQSLGLKGDETVTLRGVAELKPRQIAQLEITFADGRRQDVPVLVRIDTLDELEYYRHGGILHYVLRSLMTEKQAA